jgi:hypothetical protein
MERRNKDTRTIKKMTSSEVDIKLTLDEAIALVEILEQFCYRGALKPVEAVSYGVVYSKVLKMVGEKKKEILKEESKTSNGGKKKGKKEGKKEQSETPPVDADKTDV